MAFQHELKKLREAKGVTQTEFAKAMGLSQGTVGQYESGKCKPKYDTLEKIAAYFNVPASELIGSVKEEPKRKTTKIPVLGTVRAGYPMFADEEILDYEEISDKMASTGEYFALKVKGDSMNPIFIDGDTVVCRQQSVVENGETAVVIINGSDATLKTVKHYKDNLILVPKNPAYEPLVYTQQEVMELPVIILGKVVELRRKF